MTAASALSGVGPLLQRILKTRTRPYAPGKVGRVVYVSARRDPPAVEEVLTGA